MHMFLASHQENESVFDGPCLVQRSSSSTSCLRMVILENDPFSGKPQAPLFLLFLPVPLSIFLPHLPLFAEDNPKSFSTSCKNQRFSAGMRRVASEKKHSSRKMFRNAGTVLYSVHLFLAFSVFFYTVWLKTFGGIFGRSLRLFLICSVRLGEACDFFFVNDVI